MCRAQLDKLLGNKINKRVLFNIPETVTSVSCKDNTLTHKITSISGVRTRFDWVTSAGVFISLCIIDSPFIITSEPAGCQAHKYFSNYHVKRASITFNLCSDINAGPISGAICYAVCVFMLRMDDIYNLHTHALLTENPYRAPSPVSRRFSCQSVLEYDRHSMSGHSQLDKNLCNIH